MKTRDHSSRQEQDEGDSDPEVNTFEGARRARRVKNLKRNETRKEIFPVGCSLQLKFDLFFKHIKPWVSFTKVERKM